jgi:hypothetical protein
MAQIRLRRYEVEEGGLPRACMRCGAPATLFKTKNFSWYPSWVYILLLAGLLPFLIVALIMQKRMRVSAPLCDRHKHHWVWPTAFAVAALLLLLGMLFGGAALGGVLEGGVDRDVQDTLMAVWFLGGFGLFLACLVAACVVQARAIRPVEITDRSITLTNVAPAFVHAVEQGADEEDDEYDEDEGYDRPRPRRRDPRSEHVHDPETPRGRRPPPDAYRGKDE